MTKTLSALPLLLAAALAACEGGTGTFNAVGHATVLGTVTRAGAPQTGVRVTLTRCDEPGEDVLDSVLTDNQGRYEIDAQLFSAGGSTADPVEIGCGLFVGTATDPAVTVEIPFARSRAGVQPVTVNLVVP